MRYENTVNQGPGLFVGQGFQDPVRKSASASKHIGAGILSLAGNSRQAVVGAILVIALLAFELFNFDTTQFALGDFLGEVSFLGLRWATILAVAFGAIDFAGLAYLFAPERNRGESREVWYLLGAWLLGATMNALMTWWSVSLTLLSHDFGNEVLSRQQLLEAAPVFVAVLVWLTRILFIGAFSVAGHHLFGQAVDWQTGGRREGVGRRPGAAGQEEHAGKTVTQRANRRGDTARRSSPVQNRNADRLRQRPPRPGLVQRRVPATMVARGRSK